MSLIKFNRKRFPWFDNTISSWLDTDDFFADDFFVKTKNLPAMNVKDNADSYEVELAVPGFTKDEIDVTMENDVLSISAQKSEEDVEEKDNYTRKEFSYNSFERRLQIPPAVNTEQEVKASYSDGILKLTLQKEEPVEIPPKRKIEIA